jgi:(2Fe-2S) ferredoxin
MNFKTLEEIGHKELARQEKYQRRIFCCTSTACLSAGAGQVHTTLDQAVVACQCDEHEAEVVKTGCMGLCSNGPLVRVDEKEKDPILYGNISPDLAQHIISRHVPMGVIEGEADNEDQDQSVTPHDILHYRANLRRAKTKTELDKNIISLDLPFFTKQVKVVLSETGRISAKWPTRTWRCGIPNGDEMELCTPGE